MEFAVVREAGLEPACPSGRHPLKMVCLPVPPLAQCDKFVESRSKIRKENGSFKTGVIPGWTLVITL